MTELHDLTALEQGDLTDAEKRQMLGIAEG